MVSVANTAFSLIGQKNRPVLVIANSLGADPSMWDEQVALWKDHYQILRYGYRGHGGTPSIGDKASIEDLAVDLMQLLDQLQIIKFSYVGLSLGGMLGLYLAAHFPERFKALVAANFRPYQNDASREQWDQRIALVKEKGVDAIVDGTADRWLTERFRKENPKADQKIRAMIRSIESEGYMACGVAVRNYDLRTFIKNVQCPVMFVAGQDDLAAPENEIASVASQVKGSTYLSLPGAHLANVECSQEFSTSVLQFLNIYK